MSTLHKQFQRLKLDEAILTKEWKRLFSINHQQAEDFYFQHIDPIQLKIEILLKEVALAIGYESDTKVFLSHSMIMVKTRCGYHYYRWDMLNDPKATI